MLKIVSLTLNADSKQKLEPQAGWKYTSLHICTCCNMWRDRCVCAMHQSKNHLLSMHWDCGRQGSRACL